MNQKILRRPVVEDLTGLKRSSLYALMARGDFPEPIKLTSRAVGWPESEVYAWIKKRIATRREGANGSK